MTKPFPVYLDVDEGRLGPVLRALDAIPGIMNVHLHLGQNPPQPIRQIENETSRPLLSLPGGKVGTRKGMEGRKGTANIVMEILAKAPCHYRVLQMALVRGGYSAVSVHSIIIKLIREGYVKRQSLGVVRITEKGERRFVNPNNSNPLLGSGGQRRSLHMSGKYRPIDNTTGVRGLVLRALLGGKALSRNDVARLLLDSGFSEKNMTGTVAKLRREGLVKTENNNFFITDKGTSAINPTPSTQEENTNG